jgi:hypothetical protein
MRSGTMALMQKLLRTASAAAYPRTSIDDIAKLLSLAINSRDQ